MSEGCLAWQMQSENLFTMKLIANTRLKICITWQPWFLLLLFFFLWYIENFQVNNFLYRFHQNRTLIGMRSLTKVRKHINRLHAKLHSDSIIELRALLSNVKLISSWIFVNNPDFLVQSSHEIISIILLNL